MGPTNGYCAPLGIPVPRLEDATSSPDANYYSLLLVALLERGEPMTLVDVSVRFEQAGVAPAPKALASLKRCKPARAPIYRDGDCYALDPHDDEVSFWLFRLGLRPVRHAVLQVVPAARGPLPSADQPLTIASLDEAWREGVPSSWSAQRVAVAVLDAHGAAMSPDDVVAFVGARSRWSPLRTDSAQFWRTGAVLRRMDGRWELDRGHDAVRSARDAARARIEVVRRWARMRPDPKAVLAHQQRIEREREAHAQQLAGMRRVLVHAFPVAHPEALALVDVATREIKTFVGHEIVRAIEQLAHYDIIGAVGVRVLLRALTVDPGERRLAELGPPQKTRQLNRRGRTLTITTTLLVQGSCGLSRPFGDERTMRAYLHGGHAKLRRRLEADAKSLFALYQYGRLHGCVRLHWGFLDEMLPAPWVHRDEPTLHELLKEAHKRDVPLEVVIGGAPGWASPWSRVERAYVGTDAWNCPTRLVDALGYEIPRAEVQLARLADDARRGQ